MSCNKYAMITQICKDNFYLYHLVKLFGLYWCKVVKKNNPP